MKWDLNVGRKWWQSDRRPPSFVELEGMLEMLIIQDHMTELAIQLARMSEWAALPLEESQRQEERFRRAMEEKNALFKEPKEQAFADARRKLGMDAEGRVHSYGDRDESKCLRQVDDFRKHVEKELHRMTREALGQAKNVGLNENNKKVWETYEIFKSTFEKVADRKFMSS